MKVEVTQVLADIAFLKENVGDIRFMINDAEWYTSFPSVAQWGKGDIVLKVKSVGGYAAVVKGLQSCLAHYGIESKVLSINGAVENAVKFTASAGDDIISVLAKSLADKKLLTKVETLDAQLSGLNQNVDVLVGQLPNVQRGAFSRGVNAMKNQIEVLKNIRAQQKSR